MVTSLRKIGKLANVSGVTVLRALRDDPSIRPEVKAKIQKLAKEHHYESNLLAQGLFKGKTSTVSILVPDIMASSLSVEVRNAQDVLCRAGFRCLVQNSDDDPKIEYQEIRQAAMRRVDGLLLVASRYAMEAGHFKDLQARKIPVVLMNRPMKDVPFDIFSGMDEEDGYQLTKRLISLGHRRIAHIAGDDDAASQLLQFASWQTVEGWRRALREAGIDPEKMYFATVGWHDIEKPTNIIESWLHSDSPPTAIFAGTDLIAVGAYRAAWRLNLRIGQDISIAGFFVSNSSSLPNFLTPTLSGFINPADEIGRQAAHRIIEIIESKQLPDPQSVKITRIPSRWYEGESIGPNKPSQRV
jgi:LacI family transcriptional regulator